MKIPKLLCSSLLLLVCILPYTTFAKPLPVLTIEFEAPAVDRTMKYNIILPAEYDESKDRYPVLYLLHGLISNYTHWARMGVPKYAGRFDMIVVMPDGGNSWYVNWSKTEDGQKNAWEDYMINDVIGHVDANYRTIARREGRAINGLSMGGYGALMLGLRHPEMFTSIASHSGAIGYAADTRGGIEDPEARRARNAKRAARWGSRPKPTEAQIEAWRLRRITPDRAIGIAGFSSQIERSPSGSALTTIAECDMYDPFKLVLQVPREDLPHIHVDSGTEDFLIGSARDFAQVLRENTIAYSYAESKGGHRPDYWTREVAHSMAVQYNVIQRSLAELD